MLDKCFRRALRRQSHLHDHLHFSDLSEDQKSGNPYVSQISIAQIQSCHIYSL